MEKEFIPYEQAISLNQLGFDDPCIYVYLDKETVRQNCGLMNYPKQIYPDRILAPLFQQAFRFFRKEYSLNSLIIDSKSYDWYFNINNMIKDDLEVEELYIKTYEEAQLKCLEKLIEITSEQKSR